MINYQGRYLSKLSAKTAPLRTLLQKQKEFEWTDTQKKCFKEFQDMLSPEFILIFYYPEKELKISSDSSKSGLGAVLLQKYDNTWLPVAYASRALTKSEENYAQIERNVKTLCLLVSSSISFIYGEIILYETDHKPLVPIINKKI